MAFGGGPIDTGNAGGFLDIELPDGPRVTVLSPTTKRLQILQSTWLETISSARRGTRAAAAIDTPAPLVDLEALAAAKTTKDKSPSNGSSVALLVEHRGASVLLAADAFGDVLGAGLAGLADARGSTTVPVDAFKLPHHASQGNVLEAMLRIAPARHYLISSNGDTYHHPDDAAVARTVLTAPPKPTLWFNYSNERTQRWADTALSEQHGYKTAYPDDPSRGVVLELPAR